MLKDELEKCTEDLRMVQTKLGIKNDNDAQAKVNNTFFDACSKYLFPLLDLLLLSRSIEETEYRLEQDLSNEIIKLAADFKEIFDAKKVSKALSLSRRAETWLDRAKAEWKNKVASINKDLLTELEILKRFYGLSEKSRDINAVINCISGFENVPPTVKTDQYLNMISKGHEWLQEQHFNEDVRQFLEKIVNGTATLADLTDGILEWIKEVDFEDKISLSIFMKSFA